MVNAYMGLIQNFGRDIGAQDRKINSGILQCVFVQDHRQGIGSCPEEHAADHAFNRVGRELLLRRSSGRTTLVDR